MHLISEMCDEQILERVPRGIRILDWEKVQTLADEINEDDPRQEIRKEKAATSL